MKRILTLLALCTALVSCSGVLAPDKGPDKWDRVMILYSAGFNDICIQLKKDQDELLDADKGAYIPQRGSRQALLIYSHQPVSYGRWSEATSPVLVMASTEPLNGKVVLDTIYRAPKGTLLTEKESMRSVLEMIRDGFPSEHYGLILSSHGTGWLPEGYYSKGLSGKSGIIWNLRKSSVVDVNEISPVPVRTYGVEIPYDNVDKRREMSITDLADAIPMHLDYLYMDVCLMGGIEVAYELKDKADRIAFSPAEVHGDGMYYTTVAEKLLKYSAPDLRGVCEDFYNHYAQQFATTALVECSELDGLASVCSRLFEKYGSVLASLNPSGIQGYFRFNCHWFYDLEDILRHCGITAAEQQELDAALQRCVIYKAATKTVFELRINTYCGLSMYLPVNGSGELDAFYKTLAWNKATGLVK